MCTYITRLRQRRFRAADGVLRAARGGSIHARAHGTDGGSVPTVPPQLSEETPVILHPRSSRIYRTIRRGCTTALSFSLSFFFLSLSFYLCPSISLPLDSSFFSLTPARTSSLFTASCSSFSLPAFLFVFAVIVFFVRLNYSRRDDCRTSPDDG